jgi:hypothetical protein
MSGFGAGLLQGMAGGINAKNARADRERELSAMEALGQSRAPAQPGISLPMDGQDVAAVTRQGGSGGRAKAGTGSGNVAFNNWMSNPELARGIMETADELGMDPVDLATIISYETAGTFDPTKRGPTTQWGQHRGLIQFGEPQAKKHGVNWDDPLGSQLGRQGAIVDYYRKSGWKPGMSFLDAYSVVNAGGPGRGNRTDANNGGAPGTVADKVHNQMHGHRAKAQAMLDRHRSTAATPAPAPQTKPPAETAGGTTNTWAWMRQMQGAGQ